VAERFQLACLCSWRAIGAAVTLHFFPGGVKEVGVKPRLMGLEGDGKATALEKRLGKIASAVMMAIRLRWELGALHRIAARDAAATHVEDQGLSINDIQARPGCRDQQMPVCLEPRHAEARFASRPASSSIDPIPKTGEPTGQNRYALYVCPRTHLPLRLSGSTLEANANGNGTRPKYEIRAGIPHFLRYPPVGNGKGWLQLERLNRAAKTKGWRQALEEIYDPGSPQLRYATDETRARILDLLPLTNQDVVLEIGTGLGLFTPLIARRVRFVYSLEVVEGQAEFVATRCRQEGVNNFQIACGGDDCKLPYANESFKAVILNLVLEWCGDRDRGRSPLDSQRQLLGEIYRVLEPSGLLYLATKNRYALRILLGGGDGHACGLPFGSALPRWLLRWLLKIRGKAAPQGMLDSYTHVERMLLSAGFAEATSLWAAPDMRYPVQYVGTDCDSVRAARRRPDFVQGETKRTRIVMPRIPASLVKYFTPGLVFIAKK